MKKKVWALSIVAAASLMLAACGTNTASLPSVTISAPAPTRSATVQSKAAALCIKRSQLNSLQPKAMIEATSQQCAVSDEASTDYDYKHMCDLWSQTKKQHDDMLATQKQEAADGYEGPQQPDEWYTQGFSSVPGEIYQETQEKADRTPHDAWERTTLIVQEYCPALKSELPAEPAVEAVSEGPAS